MAYGLMQVFETVVGGLIGFQLWRVGRISNRVKFCFTACRGGGASRSWFPRNGPVPEREPQIYASTSSYLPTNADTRTTRTVGIGLPFVGITLPRSVHHVRGPSSGGNKP